MVNLKASLAREEETPFHRPLPNSSQGLNLKLTSKMAWFWEILPKTRYQKFDKKPPAILTLQGLWATY